MISIVIDLYKRIKYFLYFILFINVLLLNIINYKCTNKINLILINYLQYTINLNGCILIKIIQWINTNLEIVNIENINIVYQLFSSFYENCYIHDLNYTKKIFNKELLNDFDKIIQLDNNYTIKSGSIAQVYKAQFEKETIALKVVHPDIKYQLIFPIYFIKFYKYMVKNICFLNKYDTPFIYDKFFDNLILQTDMINEYKNMQYFYNEYLNNDYIIIPKPIIATKNILIMKYIEGKKINEIDVSDYEKQRMIVLLNLFLKDNYYFKKYYHSDLHESNWKIVKTNDFYKIIIYDYGYISVNNKKFQELFKLLAYYNDTLNITGMINLLYDNSIYCPNINSKEKLVSKFNKYLEDLNVKFREPFCDELLFKLYNFTVLNKIILQPYLFEFFISMILFKKYVLKYISLKKIDTSNNNNLVQSYMITNNVCDKYNIFNEIKEYNNQTYINNKKFIDTYEYNDIFLDNIVSNEEENVDI